MSREVGELVVVVTAAVPALLPLALPLSRLPALRTGRALLAGPAARPGGAVGAVAVGGGLETARSRRRVGGCPGRPRWAAL